MPVFNNNSSLGWQPPEDQVLDAAAKLREELIQVNVSLLKEGALEQAQLITNILQSLRNIEDIYRKVVSEDSSPSRGSERARPTPGDSLGDHEADPDSYPQFLRRGQQIVKIGLKRGSHDTYEQKLPRHRFEEVREVLVALSREDRTFQAKTPIERSSAPSYQVYLLLGALEQEGVIDSPSRGLYRFPRPLSEEDFEKLWREIPGES